MVNSKLTRVRGGSLVLGVSLSALVGAALSPAWAQCAPDPAAAGGTTTCTGTDADGLLVTGENATVIVEAGASVTGGAAPAITVAIPARPNYHSPRTATIEVAGLVDGVTASGLDVRSGPLGNAGFDYNGTEATIAVAAGGTITGVNGITAGLSPGNNSAYAVATIDNAGTISGTAGIALFSASPARTAFNITNQASGIIGAVFGPVGVLDNAGLIDGGMLSAIDEWTEYSPAARGDWSNSGTITSTSGLATFANMRSNRLLTNSGTISNAGAGAAIATAAGATRVEIINLAGGSIMADAGLAISAGSLTLTNAGTVTGDIVTNAPLGTGFYTIIDSTRGTIAGDVSLGRGNDLVYVRYDGTSTLVTGITGKLDGGEGLNRFNLAPDADLTVNTPLTPVTGFALRLAPTAGTTLTLADGFATLGTLELAGAGMVVNEAVLRTSSAAFTGWTYEPGDLNTLVNRGTIDAHPAQDFAFAVDLRNGRLVNEGTITSSTRGVSAYYGVTNTGTILAADIAVDSQSGMLTNSGTIRSIAGIGANSRGGGINSGTIEGATAGLVIDGSGTMTNSGTIVSAPGGVALGLGYYASLYNVAGGVIGSAGNGSVAVSGYSPYGTTQTFRSTVLNAGVINGDVQFLSPASSTYSANENTYVALPGGVLNGNLALALGDTLVTDLVNDGLGQFAGISGTVTSEGGLLRYRVAGEVSAAIGTVGPFATAGYELAEGARLSLSASGVQTAPLVFAGSGTVELSADLIGGDAPMVRVVPGVTMPGNEPDFAGALTIISRGVLVRDSVEASSRNFGLVAGLEGTTFQNEGALVVRHARGFGSSYDAALTGAGTLVNNGSIELERSYASFSVQNVVNTGTIMQIGADRSPGLYGQDLSWGIYNARALDNSGTIDVAGPAVYGGYGTVVTNSGIISGGYYTTISGVSQVTNLAGGRIVNVSGSGTVIELNYGAVSNAGTIVGDVTTGYSPGLYFGAAGGVLDGDLLLSNGSMFLHEGDDTGITGTVQASGTGNLYGRGLTSSGSVAIGLAPAGGFDNVALGAFGTATVARLTGVETQFDYLQAFGDGTVVNQALLAGNVRLGDDFYRAGLFTDGVLGGFVNQGTITGNVIGLTGSFTNTGTIDGAVWLFAGDNVVENSGTIGLVLLGTGDDTYIERSGSAVTSIVDGGEGLNTFVTVLAGDRTGVGRHTNFRQLGVRGTGSLTLALEQDYSVVTLADTGFDATLGGYTIGRIAGSDGDERVRVDGDVALIELGAGDDMLELRAPLLAGRYDGGAGTDMLRLTMPGPVTLAGVASGFEDLALDGGELIVTGRLGTAGDRLRFSGGAQRLTLTDGGILDGFIDLGDGDDTFRLAGQGSIAGVLSGGAGYNRALVDLAGDLTLGATLRDFAELAVQGSGTLTLTGDHAYGRVGSGSNLVIAMGASLLTPRLALGGNSVMNVAGHFAGSVIGDGAGARIVVAGGSAGRPVAFTDIAGVAAMQIDGGWTTLAGTAALGRLAMTAGQFTALAGSRLTAAEISVAKGAAFGSAGTVTGNLAVAGTLSPGASPGTMTVNGNVALAAGSTALFEITPAASDLLAIDGALTIAPGATLQLAADQRFAPGRSLDLITATGGIAGSFTTIIKPASLFGFVQQEDNRIALVGQFLNDAAFVPPVQGAVDYVNDLLTGNAASASLLAAAPLLLDPAGRTSANAFARLTPQPYAAATQLVVEQGLDLARIARGDAFARTTDEAGPFAFAAALGRAGELGGEAGVAQARSDSYGVIGGLGWGSDAFSLGLFMGALDQRQNLPALGARTDADGLFGGVHARWRGRAVGVKATLAYTDGDATTVRTVPGGSATGGYGLTGWTADLSVDYSVALGDAWTLRPALGATALRATRHGTVEGGSPAFLLDVARERHDAVFVDGTVSVARSAETPAAFRPHLTAGLRYRIDGDAPLALAALSGGPRTLAAPGAIRADLTATATLGGDLALTERLSVFGAVSGEAGSHTAQGSAQAGLRLAF